MTKLERLEKELKNRNGFEDYIKLEIKEYLKLTPYERKLADYEDFFDEAFPLAEVMGLTQKEIVKLIDKAIETNEPYESDDKYIY